MSLTFCAHSPIMHPLPAIIVIMQYFFFCSATGTLDQKHSALSSTEGSVLSQCVNKPCDSALGSPGHKEGVGQGGMLGSLPTEKASTVSTVTDSQPQAVKDNSKPHSTSASTNSVVGVYSSSSDPVHVPSHVSRSAGTVGAIRREVGVVGVRKQPTNHPASNSSAVNASHSGSLLGKNVSSSSSGSLLGKNVSSSSGSFGQILASSKSSQLNQPAASDHTVPNMPPSRSSSANQYTAKLQQPSIGHQRGNAFACVCLF